MGRSSTTQEPDGTGRFHISTELEAVPQTGPIEMVDPAAVARLFNANSGLNKLGLF